MKQDRGRARLEQQVVAEAKDRSAGELALMFMGINEVAYDLLVENPMTGYMNDIVLSRVLGHDEIEGSGYWIDSTQCWVCSKWNKAVISYHQAEDKMLFQKKLKMQKRF